MTDEQRTLLENILEALEAQPEEPNYDDVNNHLMSQDEYAGQYHDWFLVEQIKMIL
ncbi:hypothetical protein [Leuconostoc falkenbergense]|uniref:hypothetical protein n=1 Tax=Leuconostoc falkenbergense TaxID=2766470 RepID=UPI0028AB7756|nr:hypothetical protein [Leuconostoc falkenbergense]